MRVVSIHGACKRNSKLSHVLRMQLAVAKIVGHERRLAHQTKQVLVVARCVDSTRLLACNVLCNFIVRKESVEHGNRLRGACWCFGDFGDVLLHGLLQIKVPAKVVRVGSCLLLILHDLILSIHRVFVYLLGWELRPLELFEDVVFEESDYLYGLSN